MITEMRGKIFLFLSLFMASFGAMAECPYSGGQCTTEEVAGQKCDQWVSDYNAANAPGHQAQCVYRSGGALVDRSQARTCSPSCGSWFNVGAWTWTTSCPAGQSYNPVTQTCTSPCSLSATPLGPSTLPVPPGTPENPYLNAPSKACSGGCTFEGTLNDSSHKEIDGQLYVTYSTMTPTGEACAVGTPSPTTPPTDTDGDGVSDGNDGAPNNPGSTGGGGGDDGDGDGNPDGPDGDGDGNPDCGIAGKPACTDTDKNSNQSSGGGDCSSPPSSNGDQILAQIAFQTWATRCAINGMANGTPNPNGSNGESIDLSGTNSRLDTIHGDLTATDGAGNLDEGDTTHETSPGALFDDEPMDTELDQTGFGLSRGCPAPPTFTVAGMTRTIDTSYMCDLGDIIGALVILAGLAQAAWIFGGNR